MEGRKRRDSSRSYTGLESKSISRGDDDESLELITNSTYMDDKRRRIIQYLRDSAPFMSKPSSTGNSPYSPTMSPPSGPGEERNCKTDLILHDQRCSEDVARFLTNLHLLPDPEQINNNKHWFQKLCKLVAILIVEYPHDRRVHLENRLRRHLYRRENGELYVSLVAASILRIHPDFQEKIYRHSEVLPKYLPSPLQEKLGVGQFVPMRHILYGEALILGILRHVGNNMETEPEPYPLKVSKESPPDAFVLDIRKPDIFRGFNTHCLILSSRFPCLAARMHNLIRHMWILLYGEGWSPQMAMDLYDVYFKEFEKSLCSLTSLPMDSFPSRFTEEVLSKRNG